ncbi:MAG: hypothetical protein Q9M94_07575 [Candidatus Gracilibacteria bacterium]|nr:hypothetical protein [Candidatus Gracilibacteria bacterium]
MRNTIKYLILSSIVITTFFSSIGLTNAGNRGEIDKILNIKFGVEQIEFILSTLPEKTFKNKELQEKYDYFRKVNKILTQGFYKKYKAGDIDYYTTKGIIINHEKFIYQTTKLFQYLEIKIENPKYVDIDEKIINSYYQMRNNYNRINFLYSRSQK